MLTLHLSYLMFAESYISFIKTTTLFRFDGIIFIHIMLFDSGNHWLKILPVNCLLLINRI